MSKVSFKISGKKRLDPKKCYEMWVRGMDNRGRVSIYRIPKLMAEQGEINPDTGRPFTPQGIWGAANRYILENPHIAKADTVSLFAQHGQIFDAEAEADFGRDMIGRARQFLSRTKYRQFLMKHPEFKQYE